MNPRRNSVEPRRNSIQPRRNSTVKRGTSLKRVVSERKKVSIIGSGNWACTIAKIIGENVSRHQEKFFPACVKMWVFEEIVDGQKLTNIINTKHEKTLFNKCFKFTHRKQI